MAKSTPLTVKEAIEELQKLKPEAFVFVMGGEDDKMLPVVAFCPDEEGNDIIVCDEETALAFT